MTLARFAELWSRADDPPEHIAEPDLRSAERQLAVQLPEDYRKAILEIGLPQTSIALLDAIVDRELDLHDVSDFYTPAVIIEETIGWREIGMPGQLVAFAGDCCGNKFCFDADQLNNGGADSGAVWFFDHDFGTVRRLAPSFSSWIEAFCHVEPLPDADLP